MPRGARLVGMSGCGAGAEQVKAVKSETRRVKQKYGFILGRFK